MAELLTLHLKECAHSTGNVAIAKVSGSGVAGGRTFQKERTEIGRSFRNPVAR